MSGTLDYDTATLLSAGRLSKTNTMSLAATRQASLAGMKGSTHDTGMRRVFQRMHITVACDDVLLNVNSQKPN